MKKKIIVPLLISAMMASPISALAADFADINDVPWEGAKTVINDVADKSIMVGSIEGGKRVFKARDNLSYAEAAQICYTLLKSTGKTDGGDYIKKWENVMSSYKIPTWAYTSVSYCLEKSIVNISDLPLFVTEGKNNFATRENVCKFMGKAFSVMGYTTDESIIDLKDISNVAPEALPYVKFIAGLKIVVGDENKNFNPKNLINRAEMAVVCSKSHKLLGEGGNTPAPSPSTDKDITAYGVIVSNEAYNNNRIITLRTSTGEVMSFMTSSSTIFTYNNKNVKNDYPDKDDTVSFVYSGENLKSLTVVTDADGGKYTTFVGGTIEEITASNVKLETQNTYYTFASGTVEATLDEKASTVANIITACKNYSVTARLLLNDDNKVIGIYAEKDDSKVYGAIELVNKDKIKVSGKTYLYAVSEDNLTIQIDGTTRTLDRLISKFEDFEDNNETLYATLSLDKDRDVTGILAVTKDEKGNSGKIVSITKTRIKIDNTFHPLAEEDELTVKIDGNTRSLSSLISTCNDDENVTAKLTFDRYDYVTKIDATTSGSKTSDEGQIRSVSNSSIRIGSNTYSYADNDPVVTIDGSSSTLTNLISRTENETLTAEVKLNSNGKVTRITAKTSDSSEGTDVIGEIKSATNTSIKVGTKTYSVDDTSSVTVNVNDGSRTIKTYKALKDAVNDGKIIDADVTLKKGSVSSISGDVSYIEDAEIDEIDDTNYEVVLKLTSKNYTYEIRSTANITLDGKDITLKKLSNRLGDERIFAEITFKGDRISKLEATTRKS